MKKIAKKNQIVIATLAVMIAAAGVYELLGQIISEQDEDTGDQF